MNSIEKINKLSKAEFISTFGNIFEKTEWIAEKCYELKPYNSLNELVLKMVDIFENAKKVPKRPFLAKIAKNRFRNALGALLASHRQFGRILGKFWEGLGLGAIGV